ncbi:hypothetical protein EB061_10490, partial [bacterium]|nr:hypothetical protein [bacterium]
NIVNDLYTAFIVEVHDRLISFARLHPTTQPPTNPVSEVEAKKLSPDGAWGSAQVVRSEQLRQWSSLATRNLPASHGPLYPYRWVPSIIISLWFLLAIWRRVRSRWSS